MIARYLSAISTGTAMTFALLFVMQALISHTAVAMLEPEPRHPLIWERTIIEQPPEPQKPETYEELKERTALPPGRPETDPGTPHSGVHLPAAPEPGARHEPVIGSGFSDGPLVAIVRVEPQYPSRALSQGLEGYVDVQFDVAPDGTVINIVVLKSSSPVFEKSAIAAAKRFRYKSRVVDGVAQTTRGIRNRFTYHMDRG